MKCVSCEMTFDPYSTDALTFLESSRLFFNLSFFLFSFLVKGHTVAYCKTHLSQNGSEKRISSI